MFGGRSLVFGLVSCYIKDKGMMRLSTGHRSICYTSLHTKTRNSYTLPLSNSTEPTSLTTVWDDLSNTLTLSNSTEPILLTTAWDELSNNLTLSNSTEPTSLATAWDELSNTLTLLNSTEPTTLTTAWDELSNNLTGVEDILSSTLAGIESLQTLSSHMKTVFVPLGIILNLLGVIGNGSILCVIVRDKTLTL